MTEKELKILGFEERQDDGGGYWEKYRYYYYKIAEGLELISSPSDESEDTDIWYVEFLHSDPPIRFIKFGEVQALINLFEKRKFEKNEVEN